MNEEVEEELCVFFRTGDRCEKCGISNVVTAGVRRVLEKDLPVMQLDIHSPHHDYAFLCRLCVDSAFEAVVQLDSS